MKRFTQLGLIGGAGLLIAALFVSEVTSPFGDALRRLTAPVIGGFAWIGRGVGQAFGSNAFSDQELLQRNQELEARLRALSVNYASCKALDEEVHSLRAQAHFLEQSGYDSVGAHVIGRELGNDRAYILIDRGSQDHVEVGQAVIADDGVLIGKVAQLRSQVASVQLLSDPLSRVSVKFSGADQLSGVLEGRGNGAMVMTYIPSTAIALQGQLVVTAGLEEKVQKNLAIGSVSQVQGKPTDPFFSAVIDPLASLDQLQDVSVLRPHSAGSSL